MTGARGGVPGVNELMVGRGQHRKASGCTNKSLRISILGDLGDRPLPASFQIS